MKCILKNVIFISFSSWCFGQNFINPDLEGNISIALPPPGWQNVPFGDVNCQAYIAAGATPDITGLTGPVPSLGIFGTPYSGLTFISGLMSGWPGSLYHEGIMQTVSGFVPGETYPIRFYQTVVKQDNMLDSSGGWAIYIDNTLAGISQSSTSTLSYVDPNLSWDLRVINFTATNNTHTIKFLPMDDDPSQIQPEEGLRMGIDGIILGNGVYVEGDTICLGETASLTANGAISYQWAEESNPSIIIGNSDTLFVNPSTTTNYYLYSDIDTSLVTVKVINPPSINLGGDKNMCQGDSIVFNVFDAEISNYQWNDLSTNSSLVVNNSGIYFVVVDNECGISTDTIKIEEIEIINSHFGYDSTICSGQSLILGKFFPNTNYLWQDGSNSSTLMVNQSGEYWLEINNSCNHLVDTFSILIDNCDIILDMPNIFSPNSDGINDIYTPTYLSKNVNLFTIVIRNRWGQIVFYSNSIQNGWTGQCNGSSCNEGVYFWNVNYTDINGKEYQKNGFLTLIR